MIWRRLGRSGVRVSAIGLGCWAVGGPMWFDGHPAAYGSVDEREAVRAIRRAVELGITFFDTADVYGAGRSEEILGAALGTQRDEVVVATKFGYTFDRGRRAITGQDLSPSYVRLACDASLRRLGTDHIDLYQLHPDAAESHEVAAVRETLEDLVCDGKIRWYGWSRDDPDGLEHLADGERCTAVQHGLSVLEDNPAMLDLLDRLDLGSIARSPLAGGFLTGKYGSASRFPSNDLRRDWPPDWKSEAERKLQAARAALTGDGRSLLEGALGWVLARSPRTIAIPGFRSVKHVEANATTLVRGPLASDQMATVAACLASL